jgi:transcriptional regulator with XRE-family HTH domain
MLSGIETGRTSVPTDHLVALAGALGVPPVEFAKRVLRYQDPWTYEVLFEDEEVRRELEAITQPRMATRRGPRQQSWRGSGVH